MLDAQLRLPVVCGCHHTDAELDVIIGCVAGDGTVEGSGSHQVGDPLCNKCHGGAGGEIQQHGAKHPAAPRSTQGDVTQIISGK